MTILIRNAELTDLDDLLLLYAQLNPTDPCLSDVAARPILQTMLVREGLSVLVALLGVKLAGSVTLLIVPNLTRGGASYALVENVVTHKDYRRCGIGKALLAEAARLAQQAGCYKLMLLTSRTEPHVHSFYTDCGLRQTKVGFQMRFHSH
ncbi:MAG: GNAT family N-acetyltransferase [Asticcacaulis sp.]